MPSAKKIGREATASLEKTLSEIKTPLPDMKDDGAELKAAVAPKKAPTFAEAFKAARAEKGSGKTFTWGGKSYSTNMAGEGASRSAPARRSAAEAPKAADKSGLKPETEKFLNNLRPAMYINRKEKAYISDKVNPKNKSDYIPVSSLKSQSDKPAASTAKAEPKRDNTAAGRRERMGKFLSSLNPYNQADAKGKSTRPLLLTGEAAREANRKQGTIGGKAKGGSVRSVDGCAVRGKTRAMRKK